LTMTEERPPAPPSADGPSEPAPEERHGLSGWWSGLTSAKQIGYAVGAVYLLGLIGFIIGFGFHGHKNTTFSIIDAYHVTTWVHLFGPINFNKGVLYLLLTAGITIGIMWGVARTMQVRPTSRIQTAVEWLYDLSLRLTRDTMDEQMTRKWFPLVCTLFVFILVTNLIGYIPLPINTADKMNIAGAHIPSFQIYAVDTNVAIPFILSLGVFIAYNVEGVRAHGYIGYLKSLIPEGVHGPMVLLLFPLELISQVLRLLSLTIRLWANLLAGHLLIDFMAGGLAVLLGLQVLGFFTLPLGIALFLFEAVLIAGLQAFIFAILTAIYIGGAVGHH
jgi:F-type H+-transporting ATPase subunit a